MFVDHYFEGVLCPVLNADETHTFLWLINSHNPKPLINIAIINSSVESVSVPAFYFIYSSISFLRMTAVTFPSSRKRLVDLDWSFRYAKKGGCLSKVAVHTEQERSHQRVIALLDVFKYSVASRTVIEAATNMWIISSTRLRGSREKCRMFVVCCGKKSTRTWLKELHDTCVWGTSKFASFYFAIFHQRSPWHIMLTRASSSRPRDFALSKKRRRSIFIVDEFAKVHSNVEDVHDVSKGSVRNLLYSFPGFLISAFFLRVVSLGVRQKRYRTTPQ